MSLSGDALKSLALQASLSPQEEMLETSQKNQNLYIGIPKETELQEQRVALVPESVSLLVANGHRVVVETGAGENANFSDSDYSESGAEIIYDTKQIYKADIILKVSPPNDNEIALMKHKQILFSALQITAQPENALKKLMAKKITAIAWDYIEDQSGSFPLVRSMGEIAGTSSFLIAAELMSNANNGKGLMLGGISGLIPTSVVIIGAGTVGENACRTSLGLGASVIVFDDSITRLRRLQNNINSRISTSTLHPKSLAKALRRADIVIAALRIGSEKVPCVVSEEMVKDMKNGSVVVDVSIDQGGCFETSELTSHKRPIFIKHDVIHYCVPNIASRVSRTASMAISNILTPILLRIAEEGGVEETIRNDVSLRKGVYTFNSKLTNKVLCDKYNLPFIDLDLIMTR